MTLVHRRIRPEGDEPYAADAQAGQVVESEVRMATGPGRRRATSGTVTSIAYL